MKTIIFSVLLLFLWIGWWLSPWQNISSAPVITASDYLYTADSGQPLLLPTQDLQNWQRHPASGLPRLDSPLWLQMTFKIEQTPSSTQGLYISALGAYDAFWDGEKLGSNGHPGNNIEEEQPGKIDKVLLLAPKQLTPGHHVLNLNISSFYFPAHLKEAGLWALISDYDFLIAMQYQRVMPALMMTGALLLISIYCWMLYFTSLKEPACLVFGILSFTILMLIIAESWRGLWGYTYDWHILRMQIVLALSCAVSTLLCLFFCYFFHCSRRWRLAWPLFCIAIQLAILVLMDGYDTRSLYVFVSGITVSMLICLHAMWHQHKQALVMLIGLLLFISPVTFNRLSYMDQNFFVCFAILIALILYWLNQTLKEKQTQLHQSQLTASRLQLELVKKHLQPHFIMNTLTAIEEWIEESPAIAIQFIQTLADEFRCLASIADKPLVPAGQELELCQTYLTLMRYRANTHYDFVTDQVNPSLQLPPGIILTLLENAISHNQYPPGQYQFSLLQSTTKKHTELCFVAPVTHLGKKRSGSGTGNKYIRARLNESFSDNWQMKVTLDSEHWFVTISLPATLHKT